MSRSTVTLLALKCRWVPYCVIQAEQAQLMYLYDWQVMAGVNTLVGQSEERGALSLAYCASVPELQGAPDWCS